MTNYSDILKSHGTRSSGDNLLGFELDMEHYLKTSNVITSVEIKRPSTDECMLAAECSLIGDVDLIAAKEEVRRIWTDYLRYEDFESHYINECKDGFILWFVTYAPGLGVTGSISCSKSQPEGASS